MPLLFKFNIKKPKHKTGVLFFSYSLLFFSMLLLNIAQATNITVETSRNPVTLDSTFHLIYEADSSVDDDPDFSPIFNDFEVLSSSKSTNMRSVNGNWSLKKTWKLTLFAKELGHFTIPAINFGKDISPAVQLTVIGGNASNSSSPQQKQQATIPAKIFLEGSVDKQTGWLQSQFIYTVRLLRTVNITGAYLSEPKTSDNDAIIRRISEDQYQTTRQGIQYEVIERRYAIFPLKSGTLTIKPVTFEGRINATQPRSLFDQFQLSGQFKRLRNEAIEVTVNAAPDDIKLQQWLPASNVQLIDQWSDNIQNVTAGEPVTRTILLVAEGLTAVQLPDLKFEDIDGLKKYPDKPTFEDKTDSTGITGYKQVKVALIPARAGTYTLPEIKLQWWNTKTNKKEFAIIPETVITAVADINADNIATPSLTTENIIPLHESVSADNKAALPITIVFSEPQYWQWLAALFACLWLVTLIFLIKKPKKENTKNTNQIKHEQTRRSIASAKKAVIKHAKNNNPKQTKAALIAWARIAYNNEELNNLAQLAQYCSSQLEHQIRQLNQALYNPEKPSWNNSELLSVFKNEQALMNKPGHQSPPPLKPLYCK